jgi:lipid II:glycine glycyltransferase (peptidoglycan interpeptide bridge formation enzyme)
MTVIRNKDYHPEDLWYNREILDRISQYRNINTQIINENPIFLYKFSMLYLKIKSYVKSLDKDFIQKLLTVARSKRVATLEIITSYDSLLLQTLPYKFKKHYKATYLIDLISKDEEDIFASFNARRRNHVRKAIKEGVIVRSEFNSEIFERWWHIYSEIVKRRGLVSEKREFVYDLLRNGFAKLFTAWRNNNLLSGAVIVCNNYPVWWLGASVSNYSKFNGPSLIQWTIMQWAKNEGHDLYDLGGASLENNCGPTIFKKTFGGKLVKSVRYEIILYPLMRRVLDGLRHIYYQELKRPTF